MQTRTLGRTGLCVSEVGYGGGRIRPDQDAATVTRILHHARDLGFNFIDTAPTYGQGRSETLIGQAIQADRQAWIVATKTEALDPDGIRADVEGSLRRLQTDVIDVLQFHGGWFAPEEATQVLDQGGIEMYEALREEGKIRFLGFSADGPSAGVERMIATGAFDMMQIHYNLLYQSACDYFGRCGVMFQAEAQGMGIALMRSTTSSVFPKLMRQCFPEVLADSEVDRFLLNFVLSNPLVDVALMSLQRLEDAAWTEAVSEAVESRLDLRAIYGR